MSSNGPASAQRASLRGALAGLPARHHLKNILVKAYQNPEFAARWDDSSDVTFRPFAVAVLELRKPHGLRGAPQLNLIRDITQRKRETLLSATAKRSVTPRIIKALGKTDWPDFTLQDWESVLALLEERSRNAALGHVARIGTALVTLL